MTITGTGLNESFTATSVKFAAENPFNLFSTTSGGSAGKLAFNDFEVEFLVASGAAAVANRLHSTQPFELAFTVPDPNGGPSLPLLSSTLVIPVQISVRPPRNANQQAVVRAAFTLGDATLRWGTHETTWDRITNTGDCVSNACGCATNPTLGFISENGQSPKLTVGEYPVDYFEHRMEFPFDIGVPPGSGSIVKAANKGVTTVASPDDALLCTFWVMGNGSNFQSLSFDNSAITAGPSAYDYSLEYPCLGHATELVVYSDENGDLKVQTEYGGGAISETYRDIDPITGAQLATGTNIWSYVRREPSTRCQ